MPASPSQWRSMAQPTQELCLLRRLELPLLSLLLSLALLLQPARALASLSQVPKTSALHPPLHPRVLARLSLFLADLPNLTGLSSTMRSSMNIQYHGKSQRITNCCTTNTSSTLSKSWLSYNDHKAWENENLCPNTARLCIHPHTTLTHTMLQYYSTTKLHLTHPLRAHTHANMLNTISSAKIHWQVSQLNLKLLS